MTNGAIAIAGLAACLFLALAWFTWLVIAWAFRWARAFFVALGLILSDPDEMGGWLARWIQQKDADYKARCARAFVRALYGQEAARRAEATSPTVATASDAQLSAIRDAKKGVWD